METVTAYLSHSIRGKNRLKATEEEIKRNCASAINTGNLIRAACPNLELYVPAEHEEFVHLAYQKHILKETQILDIDCGIISKKELLIVAIKDDIISSGMATEIGFGKTIYIPIVAVHVDVDGNIDQTSLQHIQEAIEEILEKEINDN